MDIREKIKEIFFDYHIRGCQLVDKRSNDICNENKDIAVNQLLELVGSEYKRGQASICPCKFQEGVSVKCPLHYVELASK